MAAKATNNAWVGRHGADGDLLIKDESLGTPGSRNITFFSTQNLRARTFSPEAVEQHIAEVTDKKELKKAFDIYENAPLLRREKNAEEALDRAQEQTDQRLAAVERHKQYVLSTGVTYHGVQHSKHEEAKERANRRARAKCTKCKQKVGNHFEMRCLSCAGILCYCGTCGCKAPKVKEPAAE